jgi:(1->4)-alpha-D-glucan 1-alpha-D-glucosylmutase
MAKGLEDTAFYIYNRLLSHNEVGSSPDKFGHSPKEFHAFLSSRQNCWPMSMNATSTHDTKRGEDVRARINILSEIPSEFDSHLRLWTKVNSRKKKRLNSKLVPSKNEEYYLYQTMLGAFPNNPEEMSAFLDRIRVHMVKATREAKINSNWINPNVKHEEAIGEFIESIMIEDSASSFLLDFRQFQSRVAFLGSLNSLSQMLLKITSPGVPDFYQGTELWDLNLVDPDNRRPVDFEKRQKLLTEFRDMAYPNLRELQSNFKDSRIKLYVIFKALSARKKLPELFSKGSYIPLETCGINQNNIVAFGRREKKSFSMTVVPRLLTKVVNGFETPLGEVWKNTCIILPENAPRVWLDVFTGEKKTTSRMGRDFGIFASDIFSSFPVAFLLAGEQIE